MSNTTTIILEQSLQAGNFDKTNLIHQAEFERANKLIKEQIKYAQSRARKNQLANTPYLSCIERYHNAISIFGGRGTGKTSFLYSLLNKYANDKHVAVLKVIDPTLVEEKGHIFLLILSLINEQVEHKFCQDECIPHTETYITRVTWSQHLNKLAQGIPSLDNIGPNYQDGNWQDAEYIMNKGLRCFQSAFHLEENFHELIRLALQILNKDVFLITFDDIDIDFSKGWQVLEVIRKYMTTPQIVTLLSGNMNLYGKNIRKRQWENLGESLLKNEIQSKNKQREYRHAVNEIEEQYLLKILKPENRIYLNTIYTCIRNYQQEIFIQKSKDDNSKEPAELISTRYDQILDNYGIKNYEHKEWYRVLLLNLPIRSQIHFLMEHAEGIPKDIRSIHAFTSSMYANNIDVDSAITSPIVLNRIIMQFLLNEHCVIEFYQLLPMRDNQEQNICLTGLAFLFAQKSASEPYLIFDYFTRIGFMRNLLNAVHYANEKTKGTEPNFEELCRYAEIFQDSTARDIIGHSIAYIKSHLQTEATAQAESFGCFPLSSKDKNSVFTLLTKDSLAAVISHIPLFRISSKNKQQYMYSFHLVLGTIASLTRVMQSQRDTQKDTYGDIYAALKRMTLIRTYQTSSYESQSAPRMAATASDDIINSNDNSALNKFKKQFEEWYDLVSQGTVIPACLLGKISTRLYHAIKDIENNEEKKSNKNLVYMMNRCVIAFFNAALIEEFNENYQYHENGTEITNNITPLNTINSSMIFYGNLSNLWHQTGQNHEQLVKIIPFTILMMQCPLLLSYIDYTVEKEEMSDTVVRDLEEYLLETLHWNDYEKTNLASFMKVQEEK